MVLFHELDVQALPKSDQWISTYVISPDFHPPTDNKNLIATHIKKCIEREREREREREALVIYLFIYFKI